MKVKKIYQKPALQVEKFVMDIEIATDDFNMSNAYKEMFKENNGYYPSSEEELKSWLLTQDWFDNSSSQQCYFTATNFS